jgi:hypothetical protein
MKHPECRAIVEEAARADNEAAAAARMGCEEEDWPNVLLSRYRRRRPRPARVQDRGVRGFSAIVTDEVITRLACSTALKGLLSGVPALGMPCPLCRLLAVAPGANLPPLLAG